MSSVIKVNTLQDAGGNSLLVSNGSGSITTNNINVKDVDWQTVVTSDTTMVAGRGYIVDSSGGTKTMTLPASPSAGDVVVIYQYGSNAVTVARNSSNIEGSASNLTLTNKGTLNLVYSSSATIGWIKANNDVPETYISATGGTESTSGNFKIHSFTSSGNFVVSDAGSQTHTAEYLVVAGGAGGGFEGGGGGAGGFRTNYPSPDTGGLTISAQTYPITVGAGGSAPGGGPAQGGSGGVSTFSTITSAGGGGGGSKPGSNDHGANGGSGGGAARDAGSPNPGGTGNTPPVSPPQGSNGGSVPGTSAFDGGGGGGAGAVGGAGASNQAGNGGDGTSNSITGSAVTYAGGGGGGADGGGDAGTGGSGGGALGGSPNQGPGSQLGANGSGGQGGGGGGGGHGGPGAAAGGSGGAGIVIIRYKYQN